MCVRHLAFVLLIWFPAVLHAQKAEQPCLAPQLHGGDFIPKRETYPHEKQLIYTCDEGYKPTAEGWWATSTCENGQWSPKPQCIGSPTSSGSNGGGSEHPFATIDKCGDIPVVPNGDVVQTGLRSLKYQCVNYYKLEGPDIVVCYRDGTWSQVPTCKAAFCSVDTNVYPQLKSVGVKYIKDGESERLECEDLWLTDHFSQAQCTDGRVKLSRCCNRLELIVGDC
ncbi:complement factor H-like isoform X2 [Amphiprion ocellaris]|uniref:complement factor H-like isoform X2 n=1 Tax=Amphiprion ocellaris TaxID=80972 RepID=UPI0024115220|nr:complement factor H-like isoform X2 [Amphiprion ocellaris]